MELSVEYLPIEELTPYERNAREHGEKDIAAIAKSIEEFGFNDPIGIWGEDNLIVEGHGRFLAAERLGLDTVPVVRLDHLTDEQRRAYALAHNRTAELSWWDFEVRKEELEDITNIMMDAFGFDTEIKRPGDYDDLFTPAEQKEKQPTMIQCPNCGEWFTP